MSVSDTFKLRGIVLEPAVAKDSYAAICEALSKRDSLYGEIRLDRNEHIRDPEERMNSWLVSYPPQFIIDKVAIVNGNQLEFDVRFYIDISEEAIEQLTIVPVYLEHQHRAEGIIAKELFAIHARPHV